MEKNLKTVTKTLICCYDEYNYKYVFTIEESFDSDKLTVWEGCVGKTYDCKVQDIISKFKCEYKKVIKVSTSVTTTLVHNQVLKSND